MLICFSSYSTGQFEILGHDRHTLAVDRTQVRILEQPSQIGFGCLLKGQDGSALEPEVGFDLLCNLPDEALEGQFTNQQFRRLLVFADLAQCNGTGSVAVGLLNSVRCDLVTRLHRQVFARSLATIFSASE